VTAGGDRLSRRSPPGDCAVEIFQQSEFLAGLTAAQGEAVLRRGRRRECRAGETLFSQGDPATAATW